MSIKILHISSGDAGGAGGTALYINQSLLKYAYNVESKMLVAKKHSDDDSIFSVNPNGLNTWTAPRGLIKRKLMNKLRNRGHYLTPLEKCYRLWKKIPAEYKDICFTFPVTNYDLADHELVRWADIIHLHWVADFVDYETFFKKVDKPIVWTLHDENPLLGGFHYQVTKNYYYYYRDLEDKFCKIKRNAVAGKQISVVALSSYMKGKIKHSDMFKDCPISLIYNPVNYDDFIPIDRHSIRNILSIADNQKVFLYISSTLTDYVKGLELTVGALQKLNLVGAVLLCIGDGVRVSINNMRVIQFHHQNDRIWLSSLYSAADFMISSSYQESFGNTAVEALCCGTPVIATPTGIAPDIITVNNGVLCKDFTIGEVHTAIKTALCRSYDRQQIRNNIIQLIDPSIIAHQYESLYEKILSGFCK